MDSYLGIENINKLERLLNINRLSPFGLDNQEPNFLDKNVKFIKVMKFGSNNRHFKAYAKKGDRIMSLIGYNLGQKLKLKNIISIMILFTRLYLNQ